MHKFTDFYEAWYFLGEHHYFEHGKYKEPAFGEALDIMVVKVNPETNTIDDDKSKNTKTEIWLEAGSWEPDYNMYNHDIELDTGGATFEEAIINMANLVYENYGENPPGYGELTPEEEAEIKAKWDEMFNSAERVNDKD